MILPTKGSALPGAPIQQPDSRENPTARTPHCHAHCGECGRCFRSSRAFDGHRTGAFNARLGSFEGRHCTNPDLDERERYQPAAGLCEIHGEPIPVVVWRLSEPIQRARHRFGVEAPDPRPIKFDLREPVAA